MASNVSGRMKKKNAGNKLTASAAFSPRSDGRGCCSDDTIEPGNG